MQTRISAIKGRHAKKNVTLLARDFGMGTKFFAVV
jgi:hypothetical protein